MRTAAFLERAGRLIKEDQELSAALYAGMDPALLLRQAQSPAGRERLRLAFYEEPGMKRWLTTSDTGREVLSLVEMFVDEPDPAVAEAAIHSAPTALVAEARRLWAARRAREHEENTRYLASPERAARAQQTLDAMMAEFEARNADS
ncbi:hypothetical protein [Streptomyces agglomeratus]|uniref:hypothetical protein n=1 Tax=Streptomyces agglomeratus TaxID=285458 RepID=UPI00114CB591|nr:hypothetical protein [Streptomyces agglomeratus]